MKKIKYAMCLLMIILLLSACSSKKAAGDYYDDGIEALENGKYEDACTNFEKAIALKNDKAIYYIEYGQALSKLGKYEDAITQYGKAIVDMDSSITKENEKKALRGQGIAYYYLANYEQAVEILKDSLEIDHANALNTDIRCYLAQCYVKQAKYDEALAVYDALVEEEGTAAIYAQRGQTNAVMGNVGQAKLDFAKAISLDENNYSLYIMNYKVLADADDVETGKSILKKAQDIKPKTKEDSYQLAEIRFYLEDYDGALNILSELTTDIPQANQLIGDIHYTLSDYDKAIESYLAYINSGVQGISSTCYLNLSTCYIAKKNYQEAQNYVSKGLTAVDKNSLQELQYNEILILEQQGDFNTAYEKATAYVAAYPDDEKMQREYIFLSTRYNK